MRQVVPTSSILVIMCAMNLSYILTLKGCRDSLYGHVHNLYGLHQVQNSNMGQRKLMKGDNVDDQPTPIAILPLRMPNCYETLRWIVFLEFLEFLIAFGMNKQSLMGKLSRMPFANINKHH